MIFVICTLNAEEAIKGFDNGMKYKSGTNVEFVFDGASVHIESSERNIYSAKMLEDDHIGNIFGCKWQVEGPENADASMTFSIDKDMLKRNGMPEKFYVSRVHEGFGTIIPQERITLTETADNYLISIVNINQFSIWGVFDSNPPVPTLGEWAVIIFIGLLAGVGGWFVWRRIA